MTLTSLFVLLAVLAFQLLAAVFAYSAMRKARTAQGAVGWVVFLLTAPYFAVPIFLFLGHNRFSGYIEMRREMRGAVEDLNRALALHAPACASQPGPRQKHLRAFETLARKRVLAGNATKLLIDGSAAFDDMFAAIDAARHYVLVQFYTFRDDSVGRDMARHLMARAEAGVRVHVLYDGIGSVGLPGSYIAQLRAAGVVILNFHTRRRSRNRFQINFRNHRKIVVVDGQIGYVGGLNVGDEYKGRAAYFGHWRDTQLRLDGPAVAELQFAFAEDWLWASGTVLDLNWTPVPHAAGKDALILATGPADPHETGSLYFCNAINAAQQRLWIASPYFVPDVDILNALKLAALSGVDVRLLVPDLRDHWLVWLAAFAYFDEVRRAGVTIYRYKDGFMHSKVVLIDDWLASVGSINLDNRSCRLNFEATALVMDEDFAAEVAAMLEADFARSEIYETAFRDIPHRLIRLTSPFARLFAPITPSVPPVSKPIAVRRCCSATRSFLVMPLASGGKLARKGPAPAIRSASRPTPSA
jgi:cardiolipin synthase